MVSLKFVTDGFARERIRRICAGAKRRLILGHHQLHYGSLIEEFGFHDMVDKY